MIPLPAYAGSTVGVMGLGRSGMAAAEALLAAGASVLAWDDGAANRDAATARGIPVVNLAERDLSGVETIVWSPGIPHLHPRPHAVARAARQAGCPIVSDVELLCLARPDATFVGITGTNGKSTTTALIAHVLKEAGRPVDVGGNLGPAALSLAPLGADGFYVIELSSYQLDLTPTAVFDIAVWLNLSVDHLDRHGGMHGYANSKWRLFAGQDAEDTAIVGIDDTAGDLLAVRLGCSKGRVVRIAATREADVSAMDGELREADRPVGNLRPIPTLPGAHNWQNAAAAYAALRAAGLQPDKIIRGMSTYPGLPHRQELVATLSGIRYINDSKATNADSTERALACYDVIYWIAGGLPKEGGITSLAPWFDRIAHAYLVGAAADDFAETLGDNVAWSKCGNVATALAHAHATAQAEKRSGAVVLLSPACASFDQWRSFEARGDAFRSMVRELAA